MNTSDPDNKWKSSVFFIQNSLAKAIETNGEKGQFKEDILRHVGKSVHAVSGILFTKKQDAWNPQESFFASELDCKPEDLINEAKHPLQDLEKEKKGGIFQVESLPGFYKSLIVPIVFKGNLKQFICIVTESFKQEDTVKQFLAVQLSIGFFLYGLQLQEASTEHWGFKYSSGLLEIIKKTLGSNDYSHACQILANDLQSYLECDLVAIGEAKFGRVNLIALSETAEFDKRSQQAKSIQKTIKEAIDLRSIQEFPIETSTNKEKSLVKEHEELHLLTHSKKIITLPLCKDKNEECIGGIVFIWKNKRNLDENKKNIIKASAPYIEKLLDTVKKAQPSLFSRIYTRFIKRLTNLEKRLIQLLIALLIVTLFIPFKYKVKGKGELEPVTIKQIEAPFEATLKESYVEPGDIVKKGQLLATLDDKNLLSKLAENTAARDKALKQSASYLAEKKPAEARIAQLEAEKLSAQINIINEKLAKLKIISPIDGIVISGELKREEGSPLNTGEKLIEVAPLDKMNFEIGVSESDIRFVKVGQPVELRIEAYPSESFESSVARIKPASEIIDNDNVFIVKAELQNLPVDLRPGMKGKAKISTARKPLFWILFHKGWDFLRMLFFW